MKTKEIRELTISEIEHKIKEFRDENLTLRMKGKTGNVEKPHRIKELRRNIARMETILNEKQKETHS